MFSSRPRISIVDITEMEIPLVFTEKIHRIRIAKTCSGEVLVNAAHIFMIVADSNEKKAINHFHKISKKCPSLQHKQSQLKNHFKVRKTPNIFVERGPRRGRLHIEAFFIVKYVIVLLLQDLKQLTYQHNGAVFLVFEGAQKALQESQNTSVIKNREEFLPLLHAAYVQLAG